MCSMLCDVYVSCVYVCVCSGMWWLVLICCVCICIGWMVVGVNFGGMLMMLYGFDMLVGVGGFMNGLGGVVVMLLF